MTALERAHLHAARFNHAVTSGDWEGFVQRFSPDGVLEFAGPEVPVVEGRESILDAYLADPPTDTMHVLGAAEGPDGDLVRFSWSHGGTGSLRLTWHDDLVTTLLVT